MQISITGKLGSGKSTVCKMIRDRYDYEIFFYRRHPARSCT